MVKFKRKVLNICLLQRSVFPIVRCNIRGGGVPHPIIFLNPPSKLMPPPPIGDPTPLKNETPMLKSKTSFEKMIPRKKTKKSETIINTCVSLIKITRGKNGRNSTQMWFSHLEFSKFCKKSETVIKYYITWLIYLANKLWQFYAMCY